ncbi:MAG: hypothetical protein HOH20_12825 [Rhodospirillaceae bacterium]|nr:hypothetical protein [Rhodospirillaceae bacterium]MBT5566858.1 hypothetical protein [Rhodospirillaceae bacterium]MBT6090455.1 hypothetical protein [Rhodospirillaceae bacterium]MBT6961039.1 hypothetical protein [Rhodospirillaceae bacterium]
MAHSFLSEIASTVWHTMYTPTEWKGITGLSLLRVRIRQLGLVYQKAGLIVS